MTFVRGSLSNVAGIHGTSTRLGCHPTGGASASMPGSSGILVSPSFTPAGAWGAAYGGVTTRAASRRCASTTVRKEGIWDATAPQAAAINTNDPTHKFVITETPGTTNGGSVPHPRSTTPGFRPDRGWRGAKRRRGGALPKLS